MKTSKKSKIVLLCLISMMFAQQFTWASIKYVTTNGTGSGESWTTASNDLQAMILEFPDTIFIAEGIYNIPENFDGFSIPFEVREQDVKIFGGFSESEECSLNSRNLLENETILSANHLAGVLYVSDRSHQTIIDGITFKNGNTQFGGGVFVVNGSPVIRHCRFIDNHGSTSGGGLYLNATSPSISHCHFEGNTAEYGGAISTIETSSTIDSCYFYNNSASRGGAIVNENQEQGVSISNSIFVSNLATIEGGSILNLGNTSHSNLVLDNCLLYDSESPKGAAIRNRALSGNNNYLDLTSSTLLNNKTTVGGSEISNDSQGEDIEGSLGYIYIEDSHIYSNQAEGQILLASGLGKKVFNAKGVSSLHGSNIVIPIEFETGWGAELQVDNESYSILDILLNYLSFDQIEDLGITDEITDAAGNRYNTFPIGNQQWTLENLRTDLYADGTVISEIQDNTNWASDTNGAWCHYQNTASFEIDYGKLYNWYAVNNSKGLCPSGWRVPTQSDWQELITFLGGSDLAGGKLKELGIEYWSSPNTGATNESKFAARGGGFRNAAFNLLQANGFFWSSSESDSQSSHYILLSSSNDDVTEQNISKSFGMSVRCVK